MKLENKILLLLILIFISCTHIENKKQFSQVIQNIFNVEDLKQTDYIVIIPNHGCAGCITSLELFYNNNREASNIKYIFTNIISSKILKQKIKINNENTYLDYNNDILNAYPAEKQIYPCILEIENGEIINIYYQSPKENGLSKINTHIKEK